MAWEPDYVTAEQFQEFVRSELTADTAVITRAITAASRDIDWVASNLPNGLGFRRQFGQYATPVARYYTATWDKCQARYVVEIDDLMDIAGLSIAIDTSNSNSYTDVVTSGNYLLRPIDALVNGRPYTQIAFSNTSGIQPTLWPDSVKVTAKFGWDSVPVAIEEATLLQAHRLHKRRLSPLGTTGSNQGGASKEKTVIGEVDPDAVRLVRSRYIRLARTE